MAKFASYFVIGGLEASAGLEAEESSLRTDLGDNPLERSYKPAILRHLPDTSSWSNYNPEALARSEKLRNFIAELNWLSNF